MPLITFPIYAINNANPGDSYDPEDIRNILEYPLTLPPNHVIVKYGRSIFNKSNEDLLEYANTTLSHNLPLNTRRRLLYWVRKYETDNRCHNDYDYRMNIIANIETTLCNVEEWVHLYSNIV